MIPYYRQYQASAAWRYLAYFIVAVVLTPVVMVFASWLLPIAGDHWDHLLRYVMIDLLGQTLALVVGVCVVSWLLGVSLAWLLSQYDFWGAGFLRRAIILPFAMPAYVTAFVYVGLLDYAGPLRRFLRDLLGTDSFVPEIRSLSGGIVLMALALFPYVYVLSFDAFSTQGRSSLEAGRSLGANPWTIFRRLALSFARPWVAGGLCLVALEVLNDFGTVSIVGINTFTTAIYKVWYGFFSPETAAQLASFLILIAFLIYFLEQRTRRRREYVSQSLQSTPRTRLRGGIHHTVLVYCAGIFLLSFVIPSLQLLIWAGRNIDDFMDSASVDALAHSCLVAGLASLGACVAAACMVLAKRYFPIDRLERCRQLSHLGYGIPGSVLAIGIFLPMVRLDHELVQFLDKVFAYKGGLILTGSVVTMVLALVIRFLAVAGSTLEAGMGRISPRLDEAASIFGVYGLQQFRLLHWPLLKRSFGSAYLLVFVDVIKEMPLTLMTRPFGWDTLSVRIFSFISEGEWQRAAVPASLLLVLGMFPLFLFAQKRS